jgi:hypothetical protein
MKKGDSLSGKTQSTHLDQILGDLGYTLFTFVGNEIGPVNELFVNLLESFGVVVGKLDSFPHVGRCVCSLDGLHVQVQNPWSLVSQQHSSVYGSHLHALGRWHNENLPMGKTAWSRNLSSCIHSCRSSVSSFYLSAEF